MKNDSDRGIRQPLVFALSLAALVFMAARDANAINIVVERSSSSPSAVTAVTGEILDKNKWPGVLSVEDALRKLPDITRPNPSSGIQIRGSGIDAQGLSSPLFMVNGQRVQGGLDTIRPEDIQRVDVIRGNAASVIYGSEAVAGAVNIITKVPRFEGSQSFRDPGASAFAGNPYQAGFRSMAAADVDAVGQSLFGYYGADGESGAGAGAMFASAVRLRALFGGGLCGGKDALDWGPWPSQAAGQCLADEMVDLQSIYDQAFALTTPPRQQGDLLAYGLYGLGFDRMMAADLTRERIPGWSGWGAGSAGTDWNITDVTINPRHLAHLFDYAPDGDRTFPAPDDIPYTLDLAFAEDNLGRDPQQTVNPNDPLYKKPDTVARQVGGVLKKGIGALLGASNLGVGTSNEDSRAEDQWGLQAVGFTPMGAGRSAWDIVDGREKNGVVAVIDSGLDQTHPDRPRFLWTNADEIPDNGIDDDANGYVDDIHGWNFVAESNAIDDDYGHGTFVSGIIAANTDNGEGIAGINPGAQIMTLKASDSDGKARSLAIYRALRYAVDNGARVINISLGRQGLSRLEQIGINYAYAMGCLVVVAAGNQGGDIARYGPPGARRVLAVASLNIDGTHRSQSNTGLGVAVSAPGESIYSLTAQNGKRDGRMIPILAGDYHRLNGTSFAAPFVAGTASLILARHPHLSNREAADLILAGATDAETLGWDAETGMGRLDALTALGMRPGAAFAPRITAWIVNRDSGGKIASVDVYGVIRGPVARYTLFVGPGSEPDADEWIPAYGPSGRTVDHGHIARLSGGLFQKGSHWRLRLTATATNGEQRIQQVEIRRDG